MVRGSFLCWALTAVLFCLAMPVSAADDTKAQPLSFGVVPHRSATLTARYWNPILDYVQHKTGLHLELKIPKSVAANAEAVENGEYDIVQTLLIFRPRALRQHYRVVLRPRGAPIRSQLVVVESSPLHSAAELRQREVVFSSRSGMIAYAVPMDFLLRKEIPVLARFAGNQEGALGQLRAGEAVAAAVSSQVKESYSAREGVAFRVIWESQTYLDLPVAIHPRVPDAIGGRIQTALATMADDPEGRKVLATAAETIGQRPPFGFLSADTADYARHAEFYRNTLAKETE